MYPNATETVAKFILRNIADVTKLRSLGISESLSRMQIAIAQI